MERKRTVRTALALLGLLVLAVIGVSLLTSLALDSGWLGGERVAVIRIEGVIMDSRETIEELRRFRDNPSIKAVVLRIDSPGGGVVPSQEIHTEVLKARKDGRLKVVASMGNLAASGGYYIAAATDKIVANPGTLTGSIGVIMELANVQGLLEKVGVQSVVIKSGRYKDLASPFRAMSKEDRGLLQNVLDDVHDQFIQAVAAGRALKVEEVRPLADGRIFTGRQARTAKLVDELGDLQDAIKLAARLVGIEGEPRVVEPRKRFSLRDLLENSFLGRLAPVMPSGINLKYLLAI
ncbi:MAG: signal peptide peptidase SppA [Nitrospirae bacterium]|jgi:protease-4|nr:MAG: signal peptide peptidase SppA [Nitrospirota bacterium]